MDKFLSVFVAVVHAAWYALVGAAAAIIVFELIVYHPLACK